MKEKTTDLAEAVGRIGSGAGLLVGGSLLRRQPVAAVHELIRQRTAGLDVSTWAAALPVDLLVAAGSMRTFRGIYCGLMQYGLAPNFRRRSEDGTLAVRDVSESVMTAMLRAAAGGLTFAPLRGLRGTGQVEGSDDFSEIRCPFTGETQVAVRVPRFEWAVVHGYAADRYGNVQAPLARDTDDVDRIMAQAADRTIVTVERIADHDEVLAQPSLTYIPHYLVDAVVEVPRGAAPGSCDGYYDHHDGFLRWYAAQGRAGRTGQYLAEAVHGTANHAQFLAWLDRAAWDGDA